jgi:HK97 family phage portal protein
MKQETAEDMLDFAKEVCQKYSRVKTLAEETQMQWRQDLEMAADSKYPGEKEMYDRQAEEGLARYTAVREWLKLADAAAFRIRDSKAQIVVRQHCLDRIPLKAVEFENGKHMGKTAVFYHNGNKEKARDHPLYKILYRQPNPEMTSFVFWETLMTHLLLWGNAYAQIVRDGKNTVLGLYPLLPENVEVDRDESGELYYIYHAYTDEVPGEQNKDLYFRRDEIFHVPGLGFNGLIGFSPIAMMKNSLGTSIAVDKYGSSFFKNGAQPSGVLEHPGVVKDPNRIRDSWEAAYGGAANAHRVAVLEEGMAYKPISLPPEDSQFLETKQFSVTEICRIFRVPPHLVADLSRATFSNIEYQSLNFVMHSLTPWLVRIEQGIIKDLLLEEEQDTYFPKFNVDGLLRGDYQSRMNGYATGISNGFLSPNDVHRLENMDLIPAEEGGDDYYLNGGYVKLKDAGVAQQNKAAAVQQNQPKQTQPEEQDPEEEPDSDNRLSESMKLRKTQLSFHLKKMNGNGSQGGKNLEYRCCSIEILC